MQITAIIGQSASGKSDLAHLAARQNGAVLLSLDSLCVYRTIDVASAKPTTAERAGLTYFGLDIARADERFGADEFAKEFERAKIYCEKHGRDLIIVGGTSFYLKALISGLSPIPVITDETRNTVNNLLENTANAHAKLTEIDAQYAAKIKANDLYRIEKALLIALAAQETPTEWFNLHPPKLLAEKIDIIALELPRETLITRIRERTAKMISNGLINEVQMLEKNFGRNVNPMKAIGIKETLSFLDGEIDITELENLINTHTAQFTKRQRTFNRSQFADSAVLHPDDALNFILEKS